MFYYFKQFKKSYFYLKKNITKENNKNIHFSYNYVKHCNKKYKMMGMIFLDYIKGIKIYMVFNYYVNDLKNTVTRTTFFIIQQILPKSTL